MTNCELMFLGLGMNIAWAIDELLDKGRTVWFFGFLALVIFGVCVLLREKSRSLQRRGRASD